MAWPDLRGRHHDGHGDPTEAGDDGPSDAPRRGDANPIGIGIGRGDAPEEPDVEDCPAMALTSEGNGKDDGDGPLATVIDLWADPDSGRHLRFPTSPDASDEPLDWVFGPRPRHLSIVPALDERDSDDVFVEPTPAAGILALVPPELVLLTPGTEPLVVERPLIEEAVAAREPIADDAVATSEQIVVEDPTQREPIVVPDPTPSEARANVAPTVAPVPFSALPIELLPLTSALPIDAPTKAVAAAAAVATADATEVTDATDAGITDDTDETGDPRDTSDAERRLTARPFKLLVVVATWLAYVIVAGAAWMLIWATIPRAFGWQPIVITGGSMEPAIDRGDIILARPVPASALVPGAVITFTDPNRPGQLITHRIVSIKPDGSLETRGDHNGTPDPQSVAVRTVRGRAVLRLPYLGRPVVWIQHRDWPPLAGAVFVLAGSVALVSRSRRRLDDGIDDEHDDDVRSDGVREDERSDGNVDIDDIDDDDDASPPPEPVTARPLPPPALAGHGWRPPVLVRPGGQPRAARRRAGRRPTLIISRGIEPST